MAKDICTATKEGDLDTLKYLLELGAEPNYFCKDENRSILGIAIENNYQEISDFLIEKHLIYNNPFLMFLTVYEDRKKKNMKREKELIYSCLLLKKIIKK